MNRTEWESAKQGWCGTRSLLWRWWWYCLVHIAAGGDEVMLMIWCRWSWCSMSIRVYSASFCVIRIGNAARSVCVSWRRPCGLFCHGKTSDLSTCFISRHLCNGSVFILCSVYWTCDQTIVSLTPGHYVFI